MTLRPWLHSVEADFAREARQEEHDVEETEHEDWERRETGDPWQELGGEAA